ncbi:MAG: hypothetical protein P1U74_05570 [Legionellaceae bacterium]|nr:hypothetical protein [Legionellaceae bacterium]
MNKTIKTLVLGSLFCLSLGVFAGSCPVASPVSSSAFCSSFKVAAQCHCTSSGLPKGMCNNQKLLYKRMIDTFGSLKRACEFQHDTSVQECIDDWNCFLSGGLTSNSQSCSGNGAACV